MTKKAYVLGDNVTAVNETYTNVTGGLKIIQDATHEDGVLYPAATVYLSSKEKEELRKILNEEEK